ncbi:hypothetical protein H6P81_021220 [Aristolochia fimbriata]|uniref:Uncharacterized protein n=1 Tax=Aristolochia fimbriata TaxID=158543 RepID=A0AAV7DQF9_ARIFI|nr:hypothetical protein H6P81_021220 [Aristolochia fimbriata]
MSGPALRPYSPEPKTLISHKVRRSPKSNIRPIPGAASFMVETRAHGAATRPVKARGASPGRRGESTCAHTLADRSTNPRSNFELFKLQQLKYRYWGWNYRGCWHGLALNGSSLKGFRLYSFQLPDSESRYCYLLSLPPVSGLGNFWRLLPSLDVVAVSQAPSRIEP